MLSIARYFVFSVVIFFLVCPVDSIALSSTGKYPSSDDSIEVMFEWNMQVRVRNNQLVDTNQKNSPVLTGFLQNLTSYTWSPFSEVEEFVLDNLHFNAEKNLAEPVYNLNNIYHLHVPNAVDIWKIAEELEAQPGILMANPVPLPVALPVPPNYQSNQGYLNSAGSTPTGINANYAWTQTGGTGTGVTVCDLEYAWNYSHLDITKAVGSQIGTNCTTSGLPSGSQDHGTAVIGELVANNNGLGITGVCYGANLMTCCTITGASPGSWNVPAALAIAIANLNAGDVILLEQQWDYYVSGTPGDYIPIEWWLVYHPATSQGNNAVYSAIQTAIGNGIHVVEAAGNGYYNLDTLTWQGDSGAIIVGAGGAYTGGVYPAGDLERLAFSSYGSRVNLQGWGENVYTTGYGNLWTETNYNYTHDFSGTSSASPIVAGAVANCVGYWTQGLGHSANTLSPSILRTLLMSTGTTQVFGPSGNIGPRPDLQAAFNYIATIVPTPTPTVTVMPTATPTIPPPDGEYGDAPDETYNIPFTWDAYPGIPGMQAAHFPTVYNTSYGTDPHGACFAFVGAPPYLSQNGFVPSYELDAIDPMDPDGVPNIDPAFQNPDMDAFDDGVIFYFTPPVGVDIFLQGSPGVFYLLADLNQDGDWNDSGELLITDWSAVMMGTAEFIPIPGGFQGTTGEIWIRTIISDMPIWPWVSTMPPVWDGSFMVPGSAGEVEDYLITVPPEPTATPTSPFTATPTGTPPQAIPTSSPAGLTIILLIISASIIFLKRKH
ncbi:S8 family serine peptidase [bacterium]|nr:S8 family serine peptidase [bacterium]